MHMPRMVLISNDLLQGIVNHVFLPPRLPSHEDEGLWVQKLSELLLASLHEFRSNQENTSANLVSGAIFAIQSFESFRSPHGGIEERGLGKAILQLKNEGNHKRKHRTFSKYIRLTEGIDGPIPLHIASQNSGILVRRTLDSVVFELFEISPSNEAVYSTTGRLRRHFPEDAVAIPFENLRNANLRDAITNTLGTMSREDVPEMQPRAWKAKTEQVEERDTVHPFIVRNLFFAIIQALGGAQSQVNGFWKHTREDVIWGHGSKLPWRRSPVWLLLRAALQSTLSPLMNDCAPDSSLYKRFMVFFLSKVLDQGVQAGMQCEQLDVMSVKIARRLIKLDIKEAEPWMAYTRMVIEKTRDTLHERWMHIISTNTKTLNIQPFHSNELRSDVSIEIPQLDRYLEAICQRDPWKASQFSPPIPNIRFYEPHRLPSGIDFKLDGPYCVHNLALLEIWVANHLNSWLSTHASDTDTCSNLRHLLYAYQKAASHIYRGRPEGMSLMMLTALELWVACDKSVIASHLLVSEYKPEIPLEPWMSLSFRSAQHMKRLFCIERYMIERNERATSRRSVVFDFGTTGDFGVRYFGNSDLHQKLETQITDNAKRERAAKRQEFQGLKERYHQLMRESNSRSCMYTTRLDNYGDKITEHDYRCRKCLLANEANGLRIRAHEWPLPEDAWQAQAVVFELRLPPAFGAWRDSTVFLLQEVMGLFNPGRGPAYTCFLESYSELSSYYQSNGSNISLLSEVKPEASTHRSDKVVKLIQVEDVCLKTGPRWCLFNKQGSRFLELPQASGHISKECTFRLPQKSQSLQPFMTRTWEQPDGVAPNRVIADQHKCPWTSSVEEFKALCSLPLGRETQWPNLLVQLAMPVIVTNNIDTLLFIWQTVEQCGLSSSTWYRVTHRRTEDTRFVNACLDNLGQCLTSVKESWESRNALALFILVGCRLLSLCSDESAASCLKFLAECREVSRQWLRTLRQKASNSQDKTLRLEHSQRAYEAALVCLSSFAVDDQYVTELVEDLDISRSYLEGLITKQETEFSAAHNESPLQFHLALRCQWVIRRFHQPIQDAISMRNSRALDLAIETNWNGFCRQPGSAWQATSICWVHSRSTTGRDSSSYLDVHVNLVTGELLVNGLPRQRLPQQYEMHTTYKLLFGHVAFESMPSEEPGMRFVASKRFKGCQIQFLLDEVSNDLIVRARKNDTTWELIPRRILNGIVPSTFSNDCVYWYNVRTSVVSFQRSEDAWDTDTTHWRLAKKGPKWNLRYDDGRRLVFPATPTAQRLATIFQPLAGVLDLNIILDDQKGSIEILLPRFHLDFFVSIDFDRIYSRQYRGMCVDTNQGIGTLTGLSTKLVLCGCDEQNVPRLVLIPSGKPILSQSFSGTIPTTSLDMSATDGRVQTYVLDRHLGQIKGDGSLKSYLFLAELHAVTSGILPDPFTGHTGTEEALKILNSAAVRSLEFDEETEQILRRVFALAPSRSYYPTHLRQMQVVSWASTLRPNAQSDLFAILTRKLVHGAQLGGIFRPIPDLLDIIKDNNWNLTERGLRRSLSNHGMDSRDMNDISDVKYLREPNPKLKIHERTERAAQFGSAMRFSSGILSGYERRVSPDTLYKFLSTVGGTNDMYLEIPESDFRYDPTYLRTPDSILPSRWRQLHLRLGHYCNRIKPQLTSWLATLAFAFEADNSYLQIMLAFTTVPKMSHIPLPPDLLYQLREGRSYKPDQIRGAIQNAKIRFESSVEARLPRYSIETNRQVSERRQSTFETKVAQEASRLEKLLREQWPCQSPSFTGTDLSYFYGTQAIEAVCSQFEIWYKNLDFFQYLTSICNVLSSAPETVVDISPPSSHRSTYHPSNKQSIVSRIDLLNRLPAPILRDDEIPGLKVNYIQVRDDEYENLLREFTQALRARAHTAYERSYVDKLDSSITCLQNTNIQSAGSLPSQGLNHQIQHMRELVERRLNDVVQEIQQVLNLRRDSSLHSWQIAALTSYWPRFSKYHLLSLLNHDHWTKVPAGWTAALVQHAIGISEVQTSERLFRAVRNSSQDLLRELSGAVTRSWDPCQYPDSLLLEVESNLRIRPVQEDIASTMIETPGKTNVTMQLNMGEGKSTVIVPKVAALLANGTRLSRVIVAKPQARQMFDILVSKLGGLLNRQVYQLPVSRSTFLSPYMTDTIMRSCEECMSSGGVMLAQPEHILSLQLMTIQKAIDGEKTLAGSLWRVHGFLESHARDIVDESDENFSTKFELIYTMGTQRITEHSPRRWIMIQEVLGIVMKSTRTTKKFYPKEIEIDHDVQSSFPIIRFLTERASDRVIRLTAEHVCHNGLGDFPLSHESQEMRGHLLEYISIFDLNLNSQEHVEQSLFWETYASSILLLRGLFACRVLDFAFGQKRWRVNYGLDPTREPSTKLAVPFRAKDSPSARSEFSHPDVVICLTCLSYYYGGMSDDDLQLSLEHLIRSDQADMEFQEWVKTSKRLPASFRHLSGVNLQDKEKCRESVFPHLRYSKGVVDYFLSHLVFNKEMKEFPLKLSSSGWDIGRPKAFPLTGFSGTDDLQHILPVSVTQLELDRQRHTNALVLGHLMRPENSVVSLADQGLGGICKSKDFLEFILSMNPGVRVVLDVGAQVLDMTNQGFAHAWLLSASKDREDIQGAVFCNANDSICVIDRRGHVELLKTSPFAKQLSTCVVFLDEAHTRGIDLQLPETYRAAVTLGLNLTKDRLVQGTLDIDVQHFI